MHIVTLFLLLAVIIPFAIIAIYMEHRRKKKEAKMIRSGKASYYVKIAASGNGGVYHHPSCGKCRSLSRITTKKAIEQGYVACSVCGGSSMFILHRDLE